jgi:hypothetical protein
MEIYIFASDGFYLHQSVDVFVWGAPGCAWGGEARVVQEVIVFAVSFVLHGEPKVMFNYLIIEG